MTSTMNLVTDYSYNSYVTVSHYKTLTLPLVSRTFSLILYLDPLTILRLYLHTTTETVNFRLKKTTRNGIRIHLCRKRSCRLSTVLYTTTRGRCFGVHLIVVVNLSGVLI